MTELLRSKKFLMAVAATLVAAGAKLGLDLSTETVGLLMAPMLTYIAAQGVADYGKGVAKVEAIAAVAREDGRLTTADTIETIKTA